MPQLDKTGPTGQGSETGRKRGRCNLEDKTSMESTPTGRGNRRGFRNRATGNNEDTAVFGRGRNSKRGRDFGMGKDRNSQMN